MIEDTMIEQKTKFCDKALLKGLVIYVLLGLSLGQIFTTKVLSSARGDDYDFPFVSKDLRASDSSKYTQGNFPGSYDALAHIGVTHPYEGTNESICKDPSGASIDISDTCDEEGRCLVMETPPLSTQQQNLRDRDSQEYRKHIKDTRHPFHRIHGHMIMKSFNNQTYTASGILVGPYHVLTAAHNLCNNKKWIKHIFFAPGRNEGRYPYADSQGVVLLVHKNWYDAQESKEDYDIGMVILDSAIGLVTGWSGLLSLPDSILLKEWEVSVTGYPGEKGTGKHYSTQLWTMSDTITNVTPAKLFYEIETTKGQSGSGIWGDQWPGCAGIYTVGVHTGTETDKVKRNRGVRLSEDKFNLILHWLKTYQLKDINMPSLAVPQADYSPQPLHFLLDLCTDSILGSRASSAKEDSDNYKKGALYKLGCDYTEGEKTEKNPSYAFACFYRSAELGYTPALTALGVCYETGQGIEPNPLKAISFYEQAKKKGDAEAFRRLGLLYSNGTIPQVKPEKVKFFEEAMKQGDPEAWFHLVKILEEDDNVPRNKEKAEQLYALAKERGYTIPTGHHLSISAHSGGQRLVWESVTQSLPLNNLQDRLSGDFIESKPEGSETSYLTSLWKNLYQQDALGATITSAHKSGALTGMGGIGKSTLSLAYAYEALDHKAYDLIYWLDSETESSLFAGYKKLLKSLKVPLEDSEDTDEIVRLIREYVPAKKTKWLLIYDNVPHKLFLKNKTPQSGGHTLVTSRCHAGWDNPLHLDVFSPEDSIKYLLKSIKLEDSDTNRQQAFDLSHELGYFPLALSHAVAYINCIKDIEDYTLSDYLEDFQKQPESHFIKNKDPFSKKQEVSHENLIVKTLGLSGKMITPRAKDLLLFFSYLNPDDIPMEFFLKDKQDLIMLSNFSLIKIKNGFMSVHRLVQLVNRTEQEREETIGELPHRLVSLLNVFLQYWEKGEMALSNPMTFYQFGYPALSHLESVYEHLERLQRTEHNFMRTEQEKEETIEYRPHYFGSLFSMFLRYWHKVEMTLSYFALYHLESVDDHLDSLQRTEHNIVDLKIGTLGLQYLMKESFTSLIENILKINEVKDQVEEDFSSKRMLTKDNRVFLAQMLGNELKEKGRDLRSDLLQKLIDVFQPRTQGDWTSMISVLMESDPDRIELVTNNALKFITDDMNVFARADIISALGNIDPDRLDDVTEKTLKFLTDDMNGNSRASIIEALGTVDSARIELVIETAFKFITDDMDGKSRARIISALGKVDPSRLELFTKNALKLLTDDMNGESRARIISALGKVDPSRLELFTETALQFITDDMDEYQRVEIIQTIGKVDSSRLELFTKNAFKFITDDMDGDKWSSIIRALSDVDPSRLESVTKNALTIITDDMDGDERASIIEALGTVDPSRLELFTKNALTIITDDRDGDQWARIIKALSDVDPDRIELVTNNALKLLTDNMKVFYRENIIRSLSDVDPSRLELLTKNAFKFITDDMDGYDRASIISALIDVDPSRLESVTKNALTIITDDMDKSDRERIIEALGGVEPSRMELLTEQALKLPNDDRSGLDVADFINTLDVFDPDQFERITKAVMALTVHKRNKVYPIDFIQAFRNVETDILDQFIEKAFLPLLEDKDHDDVSLFLKTILSNILKTENPQEYLKIIKKGLLTPLKKKG